MSSLESASLLVAEGGSRGRELRVAIVQSVCPHFRVPLFATLARSFQLMVYFGTGHETGSWRNAKNIEGFEFEKLQSVKLSFQQLHPYMRVPWFPGLYSRLRDFEPDAVIGQGLTSFPNSLTAMAYAKLRGIPFVAWDSGRQVGKPMPFVRRVLNPVDRTILLRADACIGYSSVARDWFRHVGVPDERIFVAQNTIDVGRMMRERKATLEKFGGREEVKASLGVAGRKTILYVGAVERRKRIEDLLAVAADLQRSGEPVSVLVVGDGAHLGNLKELSAGTNSLDVRFEGRRTDDVGRYFLAGDVFVLPGPGGLSINQAMAYGCPVVVRGGDGTEKDLIEDGVSGFLVSERESLAEPITSILRDASIRERLSQAALASIERFGLENMRDRFLDALLYASRNPDEKRPGAAR